MDDGEVEAGLPGARGHQRDTPREQDEIAVRGIPSQIVNFCLLFLWQSFLIFCNAGKN